LLAIRRAVPENAEEDRRAANASWFLPLAACGLSVVAAADQPLPTHPWNDDARGTKGIGVAVDKTDDGLEPVQLVIRFAAEIAPSRRSSSRIAVAF
jgi:hypothetical protein